MRVHVNRADKFPCYGFAMLFEFAHEHDGPDIIGGYRADSVIMVDQMVRAKQIAEHLKAAMERESLVEWLLVIKADVRSLHADPLLIYGVA